VFRILPKEEKFFNLFREIAANNQKTAQILKEMLEKKKKLDKYARDIKELEHKGDQLTHEIFNKLNKTFVTPFDREDIYNLAKTLDEIIDFIDSAASKIILYRIISPNQDAIRLAQVILDSTEAIVKAINDLPKLNLIYPHCIEINRLENIGDTIYRQALAKLFQEKTDVLTIIKLKDLYSDLESATDCCEDVSNVLEAITVKNL
jgi:predicted phosphate transport protein (TIGR00153 family)